MTSNGKKHKYSLDTIKSRQRRKENIRNPRGRLINKCYEWVVKK